MVRVKMVVFGKNRGGIVVEMRAKRVHRTLLEASFLSIAIVRSCQKVIHNHPAIIIKNY